MTLGSKVWMLNTVGRAKDTKTETMIESRTQPTARVDVADEDARLKMLR